MPKLDHNWTMIKLVIIHFVSLSHWMGLVIRPIFCKRLLAMPYSSPEKMNTQMTYRLPVRAGE